MTDGFSAFDGEDEVIIHHAKTEDEYNLSECQLRRYDEKDLICLQAFSHFSENYIITLGLVNIF